MQAQQIQHLNKTHSKSLGLDKINLGNKPKIDKKVNSTNKVVIFHQNIQNLNHRKESLEITLDELRPNIVVLTEHNMLTTDFDHFKLNNYKLISQYARTSTSGGGVAILSEDSLKIKQLKMSDLDALCEDKLFECCIATFKEGKENIILAGIYRKPQLKNMEFLNRLNSLIDLLLKKENKLILAGDFNINVLQPSSELRELNNILKSHGLYFLVDFPTRVTDTSSTCIDNIFTNINRNDLKVSGVITALSDHDGQILELKNQSPNSNLQNRRTMVVREFSEENMKIFSNLLAKENWTKVYNAPVDKKFETFNGIFTYYFDLIFPQKTIRKVRRKNKWFNLNLKKEKESNIYLAKTARQVNNPVLHKVVKEREKSFRKKVINAKKEFIDNLIKNSNNTSKTTWNIINDEMGKCKKNHVDGITLVENGQKVTDPKLVSNIFNEGFINTASNLRKDIPDKMSQSQTAAEDSVNGEMFNKVFRCVPVDEKDILKVVGAFKNKLSSGYDDIPLKLIKYSITSMVKPVVHLINSSLISGIFPKELKISKVIPVFKKGDRTDKLNYRPISVLPAFSKIYERVMYNQIVKYLVENNLFDDQQHGFRRGKSVVTALVDFIESIIEAIDRGDKLVGILMDLAKAFDTISHVLLLKKLKQMGISGVALKWLKSYLSDRYQYVEINSIKRGKITKVKSKMLKIEHGVPQGSILGPLLFLCYLHGMPNVLANLNNSNSELVIYADDTNMVVSAANQDDLEIGCQVQLSNLHNFFQNIGLTLNIQKTNIISFSTKQRHNLVEPSINLNGNNLNKIKSTKFLGLQIDENLSWDNHINYVIGKINSGLYALKRMSYLCTLPVLKLVYYANIHSHLSYGICVYGASTHKNLERILLLQKRAIRIMLNLKYYDHVREHFTNLEILTVFDQYIFDCILYIKNNENKLTFRKDIHSYNTRGKNEIHIPQHKLTFYNKKTSFIGTKFINSLPNDLKNERNLNIFKTKLKLFLLSKPSYSLDEFYKRLDT